MNQPFVLVWLCSWGAIDTNYDQSLLRRFDDQKRKKKTKQNKKIVE